MQTTKRRVDVVIAGSGPGGATTARQLARAGKSVLLLEKGRDHKFIGNHLNALFMADRMGLSWTDTSSTSECDSSLSFFGIDGL